MRKLAKHWLGYAAQDLSAAEQLTSDAKVSGVTAFLCQQCIEKSFKSLLVLCDQPVPRIHDLVTLHERVEEETSFPLDEEQLRQINDSYIDNRYPVNELPASEQAPSLSKVQEFVAIAREVFETAQSAIHPPRGEGGVT
jgi:HEPN domain-containing protein